MHQVAPRSETSDEGRIHDVIVVGAGLAGLSAAYELRDHDVLLLESGSRLGGRVETRASGHVRVDVGACFAFNPELLPPAARPGPDAYRVDERGPLGLHWAGTVYFGADAWTCLAEAPLSHEARHALTLFRGGERASTAMPADAYRALSAFFNQIHPGPLADYTVTRQHDALASLFPDHWESGNGWTVDALGKLITADVRLGSTVTAVEEREDSVRVTYDDKDGAHQVVARAAVLATPADITRTLVAGTILATHPALVATRYARYTVVAVILDAPDLAEFRFIVTPDLRLTLVMQQGTRDRRHRTLLCYYDDAAAVGVQGLADAALVESTLEELESLGIAGFSRTRVVDVMTQRWERSGTILSPDYDDARSSARPTTTRRIALAGDYLSPGGWGYGIDDAAESGRSAGTATLAALVRDAT